MIIDKLKNASKYYYLNPLFQKVFEFINTNNLSKFEVGEYEIVGRDAFIIIAEDNEFSEKKNIIEAHRKYIDIQFALSGEFGITWKALQDCKHIHTDYNSEKDYIFYEDKPDFEILLKVGNFAILFPEDAHFAQPPTKYLKKAIIKVRV